MTWKCYVDGSYTGKYDMILGLYLLTQWSTTPIVYLGTYIFKYLYIEKITPGELLTDAYVEELYESEHVLTATKTLRVILYSKSEKENLHKVMETQCRHLTIKKCNELLKL